MIKTTTTTMPKFHFGQSLFWLLGVLLVTVISGLAWYHYHLQGLTISYNDSMSHLNLSRLVFDNIKPGFAQTGGVWLPIPHILPLVLVWNDWAWHSGFASSVFSMLSYVASVLGVFAIVRQLVKSNIAAIIGAAAFALNLNMLYLQTTPLTEPLYVAFFVLSIWAYIAYVQQDDPKYLFVMGLFGFLQVLTRYDGWFVVGIEGLLVLAYEWWIKRRGWWEGVGKAAVFGLPVAFGMGLWLLWNLLIFEDIFFFALGPYSARAQQAHLETISGLVTKHSWWYSSLSYLLTSAHNVGSLVLASGAVGMLAYFFQKTRDEIKLKLLITLFILTPIVFNVLALYLGFSVISIPEVNSGIDGDLSKQWFNVRYGILALPFAAIYIGTLASWHRLIALILVAVIGAQVYLTSQTGLITILDGTIGSSAFDNHDLGDYLREHVQPDDTILLSTSFFNAVAFVSHKPLSQFIHEGASEAWIAALDDPYPHADWIVMSSGDVGEPVYNQFLRQNPQAFLALYKVAFPGQHGFVFIRRTSAELFVQQQSQQLLLGREPFSANGVNSYDLAFRSEEEIEQTFLDLKAAGVKTIRFWMFNDGRPDGFQPRAGEFNELAFMKTDLIFSLANDHEMKVIPVLVNNWDEYGGRAQYLRWIGRDPRQADEFYSNPDARHLYKNYLNHILSRHNILSGTKYSEDPAILAWDLMNEPRAADPTVVQDWVEEMTQYIRQHDQIHLLMVGTERVVSETNEQHAVGICQLELVDICSAHLYLYDQDRELFASPEELEQFLAEQARAAQAAGKPILLGEVGISKTRRPFGIPPAEMLQQITSISRQQGYQGTLIWNWSIQPDASYGFSPKGDQQGQFNQYQLTEIVKE